MSITRSIYRITGLSIMAVSCIAVADVGMQDGADHFKDFQSTKSREEVQAETNAARTNAPQNSASINSGASDVGGVHGVPGSRYSGKTREEVQEEMIQHKKTHDPYSTKDIYFGG
jgi:hypothetical protein